MSDILASTLPIIVEEVSETLMRKHALLEFAEKFGGFKDQPGGESISQPVSVTDHSEITYHTSGYEATDESVRDILESANYNWGMLSQPIWLSQLEKMKNLGESAKLDILRARIENVMESQARSINSSFLAGVDVKGKTKAATNLEGLYGEGTFTTGFLEGKAKASQTNVVGGLSKATYNTDGWTNAWASASGAFATNGPTAMNSIYTQIYPVAKGSKPIDLIIASELCFPRYKATLYANERFVSEKELDGGRMALMFNGAPVVPDIAMTVSGRSGDDLFSMLFLNFSGVKIFRHPDCFFSLVERGPANGY